VSARLPKIHERRHNVIAVTARVNVDERSIDNRVPAAFDMRKRRVHDMPPIVATVIVAVAPAITVVVHLDEIGRSLVHDRCAGARSCVRDCQPSRAYED
jgi:hypothetical protein